MKDIPLNQETIDILNQSLWFKENAPRLSHLKCADWHNERDADRMTGEEYMQKTIADHVSHDGFPERCVSYSFNVGQIHWKKGLTDEQISEATNRLNDFKTNIQTHLNLKNNALFSVYPPGGFIAWHNNANASAYNFIFTYSETGDGWWKHYDMRKQEVVTIPDKKGWQCKAGYFGAYEEDRMNLCYHTARTFSCTRMTVAFVLERSDLSQNLQDWVIEDISA